MSKPRASNALGQQVTLVDLFSTEGNLHPLFVGQRHDVTGVPTCAPQCFRNKGSKFREADTSVDLLHRPFMALLLFFLADCLAGHGYLPGSDSDLVKDYLQPAATFALALSIAALPFTVPMSAKAFTSVFLDGGSICVTHENSCAN